MKRLLICKLFALTTALSLCHLLYSQDTKQIVAFEKGGYKIQGEILKKQFLPQKDFSILWDDGTVMSGELEYGINGPELTGQYKSAEETIEGKFIIWNSGKNKLAVKSNKDLSWRTLSVSHYQTIRDPWLVNLYSNLETARITFTNLSDDSEISSYEAIITHEAVERLGYSSADDLLVSGERIRVSYKNGLSINGKITFPNGYLAPVISFGNITGLPARNLSTLEFDNEDSETAFVKVHIDGDDLCQEIEYELPKNIVDVDGNRIANSILTSSQNVFGHIIMSLGRKFDGDFSLIQEPEKVAVKLGQGELTYETGERFVGNLGGLWKDGRPTEGTTYFTDGSNKEGDWLQGLKLINFDREALSSMHSPTEMIKAAQEMNTHNSKTKTFSGRLIEGPDNYYYGGKPLQVEEGTGKYTYYAENGEKVLHGSYSYNLALYLTSNAKDKISVTGQYYNDLREGQWRLIHKDGRGSIKADVVEAYHTDKLHGPFSYSFTIDGMKYTFEGQYSDNHLSGKVNVAFREGKTGFDLEGQFDNSGYADGKWILKDRRTKEETMYQFSHGSLSDKVGNSRVSVKDLFTDPYEPLPQYKKINNAFK